MNNEWIFDCKSMILTTKHKSLPSKSPEGCLPEPCSIGQFCYTRQNNFKSVSSKAVWEQIWPVCTHALWPLYRDFLISSDILHTGQGHRSDEKSIYLCHSYWKLWRVTYNRHLLWRVLRHSWHLPRGCLISLARNIHHRSRNTRHGRRCCLTRKK